MSRQDQRSSPAGGTSLSERIAALQKKSAAGSMPSPPRPGHGGTSPSSASAGGIPGGIGGGGGGGGGGSGGAGGGGGGGGGGVRDRIARFQNRADAEKPLLPRAAFGAPAPNPDGALLGVRRPYPGARSPSPGGSGSGSWGEGVLRPQLTGGTWLGAGAGGGWTEGLKPQLTGGTWVSGGAQASRMGQMAGARSVSGPSSTLRASPEASLNNSRNPIPERTESAHVRGSGKDAFAELDEDAAKATATAPVSASASTPSSTLPQPSSAAQITPTASNAAPNGQDTASADETKDLPKLPDAPTTEVESPAEKGAQSEQSSARSSLPSAVGAGDIPEFPAPPDTIPLSPPRPSAAAADPASPGPVVIGVGGKTPAEIAELQAHVEAADTNGQGPLESDEPWVLQTGAREGAKDSFAAPSSARTPKQSDIDRAAGGDEWVQGAGRPSVKEDVDQLRRAALTDDLPARAQVGRTDSGRVDASDPAAHKVQGPGLLVPRDEVAEAQEAGPEAVHAPLAESNSAGALSAADIAAYRAGGAGGSPTTSRPQLLRGTSSAQGSDDSALAGIGAVASAETDADQDGDGDADDSDIDPTVFPAPPSDGTIIAPSGSVATLSDHLPRTPVSISNGALSASASSPYTPGTPNTPATPSKSGSMSTLSPTTSPTNGAAAKAKEAVAIGRSKSVALRRPPPGKMLSAAELDASDDEYEPGWASVISSSRQ